MLTYPCRALFKASEEFSGVLKSWVIDAKNKVYILLYTYAFSCWVTNVLSLIKISTFELFPIDSFWMVALLTKDFLILNC